MMPLCIESYGAAVHVVDSMLHSGFYLRPHRYAADVALDDSGADRAVGADSAIGACADDGSDQQAEFNRAVEQASSQLAFDLAQAVWLVDVCGCSYGEASTEARATRSQIASRVAHGRRLIRSTIANELTDADH